MSRCPYIPRPRCILLTKTNLLSLSIQPPIHWLSNLPILSPPRRPRPRQYTYLYTHVSHSRRVTSPPSGPLPARYPRLPVWVGIKVRQSHAEGLSMGKGKMDEAAAERIKKARRQKVGQLLAPKYTRRSKKALTLSGFLGRVRTAGRSRCSVQQRDIGADTERRARQQWRGKTRRRRRQQEIRLACCCVLVWMVRVGLQRQALARAGGPRGMSARR